MPTKTTIEVYIAINEDGDVETGSSADEASERLTDCYGGQMIRIVRKAFRITPPGIMDIGEEEIPDEEGEVTQLETQSEAAE